MSHSLFAATAAFRTAAFTFLNVSGIRALPNGRLGALDTNRELHALTDAKRKLAAILAKIDKQLADDVLQWPPGNLTEELETRSTLRKLLAAVDVEIMRQAGAEAVTADGSHRTGGMRPADADADSSQYVTLDQMAALVNRSKKTLEREMNAQNTDMPKPDVEGGGGKPHEWRWDRIRPWLETKYARQLPKQFPTA